MRQRRRCLMHQPCYRVRGLWRVGPGGILALSAPLLRYRLGRYLLPGSVMLYLNKHYKLIRLHS